MTNSTLQILIFFFITAAIAVVTFVQVARTKVSSGDSTRDYFLAGGGLSWVFVAGSITLTNLSTEQLVGMNGSQMLLLAWWEFAAVIGLVILAKVFLPIYYNYKCLTTTELLEKRFNSKGVRAAVAILFMLGNIFIFLPTVLYTGSLFMQSMFSVDINLVVIAAFFAILGSAYAIFGGLRAVAISDTYSGVLLLGMGLAVVFIGLQKIGFSFEGVPVERLTLIGNNESEIPWHTLLTGMIFIQIFYWSTNQTITQRAMASPTLAEAKKGVFAAALIRFLVVPPMIVIPGVVAYKLFGDVGDSAYGLIVNEVLPFWLSGVFAAAIAAAVLTSFNSILNATVSLYVCDIHESYINASPNVRVLSGAITVLLVVIALILVPFYAESESIITVIQKLYGLLSMPILSAFIVGLLFNNIRPVSVVIPMIAGVLTYYVFSFQYPWAHFIHMMFATLCLCIVLALVINRVVYGESLSLNKQLIHLIRKG